MSSRHITCLPRFKPKADSSCRTDFLQSITANDGSLLPPSRGRSHSRQSSASSNRSASPALSISSQGSSMSHHSPRMSMPDESEFVGGKARSKMPRMKVTSMATEVASSARRTNDGVFLCPSESEGHPKRDQHVPVLTRCCSTRLRIHLYPSLQPQRPPTLAQRRETIQMLV